MPERSRSLGGFGGAPAAGLGHSGATAARAAALRPANGQHVPEAPQVWAVVRRRLWERVQPNAHRLKPAPAPEVQTPPNVRHQAAGGPTRMELPRLVGVPRPPVCDLPPMELSAPGEALQLQGGGLLLMSLTALVGVAHRLRGGLAGWGCSGWLGWLGCRWRTFAFGGGRWPSPGGGAGRGGGGGAAAGGELSPGGVAGSGWGAAGRRWAAAWWGRRASAGGGGGGRRAVPWGSWLDRRLGALAGHGPSVTAPWIRLGRAVPSRGAPVRLWPRWAMRRCAIRRQVVRRGS